MLILKCCLKHSVVLMSLVIQNDILNQRLDITKGYFFVYHMSLYLKY